LCSFLDHTPERVTEEALFHRSPNQQSPASCIKAPIRTGTTEWGLASSPPEA
jgi:hypothetical protein